MYPYRCKGTQIVAHRTKNGYLDKNGEITNYRAQLLTNKSDISVKKYFAKFVEFGLLEVEGKNKGRKYRIKKSFVPLPL